MMMTMAMMEGWDSNDDDGDGDNKYIACCVAQELSSKVMDERERLSINSKSRATSRTTSRAGSPSLQKSKSTHNRLATVKAVIIFTEKYVS